MNQIFKALADPSRRALLDGLFEKDGQSLGELCNDVPFSRQAASKHLRILEEANLVVTHWAGREKLHYLNPIPIQQIADRWIAKYAERSLGAMTSLKKALEESDHEKKTDRPQHIYEIFIRARPEEIWAGLTTAAFTRQYFFATEVTSDWQVGSPVTFRLADGAPAVEGHVLTADPPNTLSYTWRVLYDTNMREERPSRVTFRIEPTGDVCKLTVIHDDFAPESKVYPEISKGWSAILCSLKSLLETGSALPIAGNENRGTS